MEERKIDAIALLRDDSLCLILKLLEITEYTNSNGETQENSKKEKHALCVSV